MSADSLKVASKKTSITYSITGGGQLVPAPEQPLYTALHLGNLSNGLEFLPAGSFDAAISVGTLSYVEDFPGFFGMKSFYSVTVQTMLSRNDFP